MRAEKNQLVQEIQNLAGLATGLFLIGYKGLTAAEFEELRGELNKVGAQCHVIPNRLFKRAMKENGVEAMDDYEVKLDNAMICGGDDVVAVAKVIKTFSKAHENAPIRAGLIEDRLCSAQEVEQLAELPSKEALQAQLLGVLQAPAGQFVRVLNAKVASVVYALSAYLKEKENVA